MLWQNDLNQGCTKILGATSKFQAPQILRGAISMLRTQKFMRHLTKFVTTTTWIPEFVHS